MWEREIPLRHQPYTGPTRIRSISSPWKLGGAASCLCHHVGDGLVSPAQAPAVGSAQLCCASPSCVL